ncbi:MAG TPA: hypothetical protein ENI20_03430, partial [Bacteroides sp.]|nr:hypothetical protein [Bacteroides sp.]
MADEVDKDLNMIQPAKTGSEIALEQLLENSEDVAVLTPQITTQKGLDKYKEGVQADAQFLESFQTGEVDKDLDANRSMFEDVTSVRARNQGEGIKGLKAIGGGLYMGALIAMEQAGYVADIDTYANFFRDIEDVSGNAWTRLMKDMQEKGRESGIFKIWEQTPDENSLASQVFKWTSLEGAISSAVGFGVTGLGAARLVSYLGSMKKFATLGKLTDAVMGNVAGKSMAGATKQFVGPLAASGMSNFFMGQLMAADTFNQTMAEFKPRIDSGELGEYEVQKIASNNAQEVVGLNMALSLTAYLKFGSIFKRRQQLKSLVANPTALHQMKGLIARGSPTAFTENVYQEMIQMEQLHDVKGAFGIEDEYAENYWDRMSNLALSNRALHAGALGIAGGPIQFAIIQRPMMGRQLAEQRNIYNKQQESLDWHKQVVANGFAKFQDYERIIGEAILEGNAADAEFVGDLQVLDGLADSVEWGTLDYLRKDIETILAYDQAEAIEKGYTQADYKETAQKFLDTISSAEQITLAHAGVINRGEVAFNRLAAIRTAEALVKLEVDAKIAHTAVQERARLHLNLDADVRFDEKFNIARDPNRHVNLTEQQKARAVNKEKAQDESLNAFLANSADYGAYLDSFKDFNKYIKLAESLDKRYKQITSDKYQKDLAKRENERGADLKRAITADKQAKEEDIVQEEFSRFKPFARVVAEVPTEEVQKTLKTDFTGEVKGRTPKRDATFSAIDENGVLRNYTKGDKVRSVDGRIFKVDSQNRGTKGESQAHMPILYEVGTDGKAIIPLNEAGEKVPFDEVKFVLGDNTFLRTEVLQKYKNGQYAEYWAPYVNPDSLLKPNDPLYQHGRLRMLSKARAKSLNISARAIREAEFGWTERYAMEQLDIPFQAPYEIYLDVKKVGERETHVDVYKKTPAGQSDVLLTRLDRDYNLNYEAIINAAAKGRVTGKVVEHFSSGKNIVRRYDEDGNRLFSSINEMHKMDSEYLPNGRVILAQVKRGDAPIEVAADTEGTVYNKGFIEVTRNGIKESLDIPYHAMTPGDTYVLIVTPSGRLAPIATTTKSIQDMPSTMGDNFTSDVSALISESINSVYKEEIENQVESDKTIRT